MLTPPPHPATLDDEALLRQCRRSQGRGGGPGGQHRNKVETRIVLTHGPTGVQASAAERRSARDNLRVALFRLRLALAVHVRTPVPASDPFTDTRSERWKRRVTSAGRIVVNPRHRDYPALLAEALDAIYASGGDPRRAAARLGCSPTQLVRLVRHHPPALAAWNALRAAHHLHPLR